MDLEKKLQRSRSKERIDFSKFQSINKQDPLVKLHAGLASCMTEWWHFSYGDQLWAWFYNEEHSLYSPVDI